MKDEKLTTVQIDVETRDMLKELAETYERTAAGQLRWLVNQEYTKLKALKLLEPKAKRAKKAEPTVEGA